MGNEQKTGIIRPYCSLFFLISPSCFYYALRNERAFLCIKSEIDIEFSLCEPKRISPGFERVMNKALLAETRPRAGFGRTEPGKKKRAKREEKETGERLKRGKERKRKIIFK